MIQYIRKEYKSTKILRNENKRDNIGKDNSLLLEKLKQWYQNIEKAKVSEMQNFKSLVERHQGMIMNYFEKGETNAIAEGINIQIQGFGNISKGIRDLELFCFRLAKYSVIIPQNKK